MATAWVLGSMGWMPARGQQTCCVLVEIDDELILLDAGTGVANLAWCSDVLRRHDHVSVLLSHYHLDHVAGLMYLKRFVANKRVDVYGPGKPVYQKTTEGYLGEVLQRAVYGSGHKGFAREVCYHDYGGQDFAVGNVRVGVRAQHHSAPSYELRLNDVLVYATDTHFDAASWREVPPAQMLMHECWQIEDDDVRHTSAEALVAGLPSAAFDRVLIIHQNPAWSKKQLLTLKDKIAKREFELARDGMVLEL